MDFNTVLRTVPWLLPSTTGSWGTPDYGLTELFGYGNTSPYQNNQQVQGAQTQAPMTYGRSDTVGAGPRYNPVTYSSNNGGVGNRPTPGPTPGPTGPSEFDLARQARDNRIASIRGMFDRTKDQANSIRSQATNTFNDLLKAVTAFRERAGTQFNNAGQEITNTASGILGSNARTAQEALGTSRALGRSLGLGDSSKFNQQNKVIGNLAGTQGSTLAARGEQNRSNRLAYDERLGQAQSQEDEAGRYRTALEDQARQLEATGLGQFGDDTAAADNAFGQSLNGIINYQRQLAQINPVQAAGLTQFNPDFGGITNTLNGITPTAGAGATGADPNAGANPVYDPSILALLKRRGTYAGV
jgi:hypothetical protein